jgi:hypothetical protein
MLLTIGCSLINKNMIKHLIIGVHACASSSMNLLSVLPKARMAGCAWCCVQFGTAKLLYT